MSGAPEWGMMCLQWGSFHICKKTLDAAETAPQEGYQPQRPREVVLDRPGPQVPYTLAPHKGEIIHRFYHRLSFSDPVDYERHQGSKKSMLGRVWRESLIESAPTKRSVNMSSCDVDPAILGFLKLFGPHGIPYHGVQFFKLYMWAGGGIHLHTCRSCELMREWINMLLWIRSMEEAAFKNYWWTV